MSEDKDPKKDFIVKDRRFSAQEEQKPEKHDNLNEPTAADAPKNEIPEPRPDEYTELPEINFMTFVMSLNASAMVHLGVIDDPASGEKTKSLTLGKQTIDILGMIEEKTRGNLNKDEENMLKNILYDLRIIYIKEKS